MNRVVNPRKDSGKSDFIRDRLYLLYPETTVHAPARAEELERILAGGGDEASALRARLMARMGDVSEFMKTLKQRFSIWFNRMNGRFGTLWSERFKSVLVEGRSAVLRTMAAYIDLNPVRAGLAEDPKDYRFCGYAEAVAGRGDLSVLRRLRREVFG